MLHRTSPSSGAGSPRIVGFYDEPTGSCQFILIDESTRKAALIDIVRDFDPASARIEEETASEILDFVRKEDLKIEWILDTHPHADHLMASTWLKRKLGVPNAIGAKVKEIADLWRDFYNLPDAFDVARDFDRLFSDGDTFRVGELEVRVMLSGGHTLGSISYVAGDAAFVHDTFMQPDFGTARADFPGGSARTLYRSLQRFLDLPDDTRVFVGHDYGTDERDEPAWESTVAEQRRDNVHIGGGVSEAEFVKLREERDETLGLPDRMLFALQYNLRGGRMSEAEDDGYSYFKIPANRF